MDEFSHDEPISEMSAALAKVHQLGSTVSPVLMRGATGAAVKELQAKLIAVGAGKLDVTGTFDGDTEAALRAFQAAEGIGVTGSLTPETEARLNQRVLALQGQAQMTQQQKAQTAAVQQRPLWQSGLMVLGGITLVGGIIYLFTKKDEDETKMLEHYRTIEHDPGATTKFSRTVAVKRGALRGDREKCPRTPGEEAFDEGESLEAST